MAESANHRINNLMERLAIGVLVVLLSLTQTQYWADKKEMKEEIKELNAKVLDLYRTSVTKQELKEMEERVNKNAAAVRDDVKNILELYLNRK